MQDSSLTNINGISTKKIKESLPNIISGDFNFQEVAREDVKKKKFECKNIGN